MKTQDTSLSGVELDSQELVAGGWPQSTVLLLSSEVLSFHNLALHLLAVCPSIPY